MRIFGWVSPKTHSKELAVMIDAQTQYRIDIARSHTAKVQSLHTEIANLRQENLGLRNQIDTSGGGVKRRISEAKQKVAKK